MKPKVVAFIAVASVLALAVGPGRQAAADDETDEVEIKVQAPLDAADCGGTPPAITVLGLRIDISAATIEGEGDPGGCATLTPGRTVEVELTSDALPLSASKVEGKGGGEETEVKAPVQAVDPTRKTITLLGLTIDVSAAKLEGADDEDTDGEDQPIDFNQLMVGQFVAVKLEASKLPARVATELEVKNFSNEAEVEVVGPDGQDVDDIDEHGAPDDDIDVEVEEAVTVRGTSATPAGAQVAGATTGRRVRKVLHFRTTSNGSFTLQGLPTGRAKITATRVRNGGTMTGRRRVRVKGNTTRTVRLRLHRAVQ